MFYKILFEILLYEIYNLTITKYIPYISCKITKQTFIQLLSITDTSLAIRGYVSNQSPRV